MNLSVKIQTQDEVDESVETADDVLVDVAGASVLASQDLP